MTFKRLLIASMSFALFSSAAYAQEYVIGVMSA